MAAATDRREFEFNKFGTIGRAAGFLVVAAGFMVRAVVRDFEGEFTVSNVISEISPLGVVLFTGLLVGFGTLLVRALLTPKTRLTLTNDDVAFHGRGKPKRIALTDIQGVAAYEKPSRFALPGRRSRGSRNRVVVVLSENGTNLDPVPTGVRWLSGRNEPSAETERGGDAGGVDALVEEILADADVLSQFPDDEFGNSMRSKLGGTPAGRVKRLKSDRPDTKALVIPLAGMPTETEEQLRAALPNWF